MKGTASQENLLGAKELFEREKTLSGLDK